MCERPLPLCAERFSRIDARLAESAGVQAAQGEDIRDLSVLTACLSEKLSTLTASVRSLTRALWSVAGAVFSALVGFLFWYIRNM